MAAGAAISGPIASSTSPLLLGAASASNIAGMRGQIDEVRLYDRALSAAEVQQLHASY